MRLYLAVPLLALAATLQSSIIPQIRIAQGQPDLVFLLVLAWSVNAELDEGVAWAFIGGVCQDLLSLVPVGTSSMGMILLVFGISGMGRQIYRVGLLLLVALVLAGTLLQQLVSMIILSLIGMPVDFIEGIRYVVLPTMLYNLVLIWPIYWFVRVIQRRGGDVGHRL